MTQTSLVYDSIFLNEADYDFFSSLPNREKLLFLFDLCLEVEGPISIDNDEDLEELDYEDEEKDEVPELFSKKMLKFIDENSKDPNYVHIVLLPDILVIATNNKFSMNSTKNFLFNDGYIFVTATGKNLLLDIEIHELRKRFRHLEVFDLLEVIHPTSLN